MKKLFKEKEFVIYSMIFSIIALVVFFLFIVGDRLLIFTDYGSDTLNIYWPFYKYLMSGIKEGNLSFWSFNMGIGTSIFSMSSLIFDPFNIILLGFPINLLPYGILIAMIAKMYFAGGLFYIYLDTIKINKKICILSSLIWAFNGFIILWGQHYMFASTIVFFTIVTLGIEKYFLEKKVGIFIIGMVLSLITSPYMAYTITIYVLLYTIIRYVYNNKIIIKEFIKYVYSIIKIYIISIGISAPIFIPTCYLLLNSPRLNNSSKIIPKLLDDNFSIAVKLLRLFSNNLTGTVNYIGNSNYYEVIILSSSVIMILLLPQLFHYVKEKRKRHIIMIMIILTIIGIISPTIAFVFNGFSAVAYRWSFVIVFEIVLGGTLVLNNIISKKSMNRDILIASTIFLLFILLFLMLYIIGFTKQEISTKNLCFILIQCIEISFIMISICLILSSYNKNYKRKYEYLILFLVIVDISSNSYISFNLRETLNKNYITSNQGYYDNTKESVEFIKNLSNKNFVRIDKSYKSVDYNDSLFQNYYGITAYNSLNSKSYYEFCEKYENVLYNINKVGDYNQDNLLRSYLGIKYILSKEKNLDSSYKYIDKYNDIYIYENRNAFPLGFSYDNYVLKSELDKKSYSEKIETLMKSVILDDDIEYLQKKEITDSEEIDNYDISTNNINMVENTQNSIKYTPTSSDPNIILSFHEEINDGVTLEFELIANENFGGQFFYENKDEKFNAKNSIKVDITKKKKKYSIPIDAKNLNKIRIDMGKKGQEICIKNLRITKRINIDEIMDDRDILKVDEFNNSIITGKIEVKNKEILCLSIPYCNGWNVFVDDKKVNTINVNYGFIGIQIEEGNHNIELKYVPPGLKMGMVISFVTIACMIIGKRNIIKQRIISVMKNNK